MSTPAILPQQPSQSLPPRLRAGDLFAWAVQTTLAAGSTVSFVLNAVTSTAVANNVPIRIKVPPVAIDVNAVASFSIPGATTTTWQPGRYEWICFGFDASGNRTELSQGVIRIEPDPNGATPPDPRTYNEQLLGAIKSLLAGKALDDAIMYKVGTREITKMPIRDLLHWEGVIASRVRRERIRRGEFVRSRTPGITFGGRS